jgi:hypothetical protein
MGWWMLSSGSASGIPFRLLLLEASLAVFFGLLSIYGIRNGRFPKYVLCHARDENRFMFWFWVALFTVFTLDLIWAVIKTVVRL